MGKFVVLTSNKMHLKRGNTVKSVHVFSDISHELFPFFVPFLTVQDNFCGRLAKQ